MRRVMLSVVLSFVLASSAHADRVRTDHEPRTPVMDAQSVVLTSSGTALAARETTGPDTFVLYGGPAHPTEGKFQLANGTTADWGGGNGLPGNYGGGPDAWQPVDGTFLPVFWHRSQWNAQTLGTVQPGPNHAMWCGVDVDDPLGYTWEHVPGYGNSWNDALLYESAPLADTSVSQTVALDFYFHHDTEPGYDYFNVQYDSAGTWTSVLEVDGSDKDSSNNFNAPGVQFSASQMAPIYFEGFDYGGNNSDQVRIRLLVTSDGAWSDADGLWPTHAGAAQVDEITLTTSQGTFTEDYETVVVLPAKYLFQPDMSPFAGDFSDVYPRLTDIDPCRDNLTPVVGFIDYGQVVRNGPAPNGATSVPGGSTSPGINYGIAGNYVVNYTGGLSFGEVNLYNEIWSPDIYWDLPEAADDDIEISGAFIRWTGWVDLPLYNGIFYVWAVRSALAGEHYNSWQDRNYVYYGGGVPRWRNVRQDVSDILQASPERVQMSFGALDYASYFGFPGYASTPAPCFDNAAFYKYRIAGPVFSARAIDLAQDGFPVSGSIDVSSSVARDGLDIPFSMARDVNSGDQFNVPGDSIIFDVASVIPGASVTDIRMVWALHTNAVFEDAVRAAPGRSMDVNVVAGPAGTVWTGDVVADTSKTSAGAIIADRYFADLPDADFMYPGDVLHYYIQATDSDGRTSTLPADTTGFLDFAPNTLYDRQFTVRALPTITDAAGTQPGILVINDFGHRGGEEEWWYAGLGEGIDYDTYTVRGPSSGVSNGIGSSGAHGANPDQLEGYNHLFYFSGDLDTYLLSNGSNRGSNDKGDDIGVLTAWHDLAGGPRNCAYFGDNIASALVNDSAEGLAYVNSVMGVAYGDENVRDVIGGQTAPLIVPNVASQYAGSFATSYVAYGGCLDLNEFDQIQPAVGAEAGHLFTDVNGQPIPPNVDSALGGVASVIHDHGNGLDITFPHAFHFNYTIRRAANFADRTYLTLEILGLFSIGLGAWPVTDVPPVYPIELSSAPNPFNPVTVVRFTAPIGSKGSVKVFNLRGELVRTLHGGEFLTHEFRWDGVDDRGASVASGVYVVRAETEGTTQTTKVALVK